MKITTTHQSMLKTSIIQQTIAYVQSELSTTEAGHNWWHIYRVWKLAQRIAQGEEADQFVVELGALLHDIADSKFHNGDEEIGSSKAREFLSAMAVDKEVIDHIEQIIRHISFKGGNHEQTFHSPELDIIQDADRLDAMGAIGIARTFNYGGHKGRDIYDPAIPPSFNMTKEEYKNSNTPTLNHFYEKLLLLKERMNTRMGKELAEERHRFMELYLEQFYKEWEGVL
ncbi:HD domain-containing protein [Parabacteroides sp. FAFU027]|uniref:HD domain-containing protein n=1 Tax=Parabacteroides sp. FAFU027 TaxID=2922715 RepID=UPI001FB00B50|nr:HD domain-containing protein [Parabacteroides sp. FAFU027]